MGIKTDKAINLVSSYKLIKANINEIDFKIEELDDECIMSDQKEFGTTLSKTNNINSVVEKTFERKQELQCEQNKMRRQLRRIDNALSILTDEEREIIETVHINNKKYCVVQEKLNFSYQRIKQLEKQAANKMEEYVFPKES